MKFRFFLNTKKTNYQNIELSQMEFCQILLTIKIVQGTCQTLYLTIHFDA